MHIGINISMFDVYIRVCERSWSGGRSRARFPMDGASAFSASPISSFDHHEHNLLND
jgi:hypothetical protein